MWKSLKEYSSPILATLCWAFSYVWTSIAFESFYPITLVTLRVIFAFLFMLAITLPFGKLQRIHRKHIVWLFVLGILEPFGYFLCEVYGLKLVSPTYAAVILSTIPLFSPLIAYITLKEKVTLFNVVGILVSLFGVLAISIGKDGAFLAEPLGVVLLFGAVFISIAYSVAVRKLSKHYSVLTIVTYQNFSGIFLFLPLYFFVDYGNPNLPFTPQAFFAVILLAVFASALAFVFYATSLNKFGVTRTNIFLNLLPAITAGLSVALLGEVLSWQKVIGIVVVISGLFVSQIKRKPSLR